MDLSIFSVISHTFDVAQNQRVKQRDILVMIGDLRGPMLEIFDYETSVIDETRKYVISLLSDELENTPFTEKTQKLVNYMNKANLKLFELHSKYRKNQEKLL